MKKEFVSYELAKLLTNIGMNKDRKTFKSKNIVGQRVKDFKNKTCTLIKWK